MKYHHSSNIPSLRDDKAVCVCVYGELKLLKPAYLALCMRRKRVTRVCVWCVVPLWCLTHLCLRGTEEKNSKQAPSPGSCDDPIPSHCNLSLNPELIWVDPKLHPEDNNLGPAAAFQDLVKRKKKKAKSFMFISKRGHTKRLYVCLSFPA